WHSSSPSSIVTAEPSLFKAGKARAAPSASVCRACRRRSDPRRSFIVRGKKNARLRNLAFLLEQSEALRFGVACGVVSSRRLLAFHDFGWRVLERIGQSTSGLTLGCLVRLFVFARHVIRHAGACRNQAANNDVLFQATQIVALAHDGGFGQDTRGFLERSGRNERV